MKLAELFKKQEIILKGREAQLLQVDNYILNQINLETEKRIDEQAKRLPRYARNDVADLIAKIHIKQKREPRLSI